MKTKKIAELIEWINTEPYLTKVKDGFYYHNQFFTNKQIIQIYDKQSKTISDNRRAENKR